MYRIWCIDKTIGRMTNFHMSAKSKEEVINKFKKTRGRKYVIDNVVKVS